MDAFKALIGRSPNFEAMLRSAQLIAATDVTILITGETGTGKEVIANALQKHSSRADQPFVTLNCAALPEGVAESELFGHCKGSFTGALSNQTGRLQAAHHGTVFLDEVDSLSLALQAKLLRFLETGECQPVGQARTQTVDVRILAATNTNLQEKIAAGEFRQDLFFRLNVVPLQVPPLRERSGDVDRLVDYFMTGFSQKHRLEAPKFSKTAMDLLRSYSWPGNVRELRNLCERLLILLPGRILEASNIPYEIHTHPMKAGREVQSGFILPEAGIDLEALEIDLIYQALVRTNGNRSKAARLLGMSRDTFLYRIHKYGIWV
ncbi:MAG: sigma-54 dependent transcriptional regulator [Methylococcaceae bacterium]|nr:sigma-54 dependent transcriptional regulator [Methylococcaceae bacterium]